MCRLSKEEYSNLLQNSITSKYKKTDKNNSIHINKEGIKHAKEASIINRIEINGRGNSFITLKDHNKNFLNRLTTRLLNTEKNENWQNKQTHITNINTTLSEKIKVNECKNTSSVINWFKKIPNKSLYKFLMFDIKDFFPSIKQKLLWEVKRFSKRYISMASKDIDTIFHAGKSLLYYNDDPWVKKGDRKFDVEMGTMMGQNHVGWYTGDGLAILKNTSGPAAEKLKKKLQKNFKEKDREIIVQCNLKITNYLNITPNLNDGSYLPYRKLNYIHVNSDHSPSIIKETPQLKKDFQLSRGQKIFFRNQLFIIENA